MPKLNLNKPSHIMLTWAGLTIMGFGGYALTKNGIYIRRREQALPSSDIPTKVADISWEERIAIDEANAAKKGYKVDYRNIHKATEEAASQSGN